MELAKYYKVFLVRAKVALEAGVDLSNKSLVSLTYCENREKDTSLPESPVWRDPMIKIELGIKEVGYLKIIIWDTRCRQWYLEYQDAVNKEQLAHLFLEKAGMKYQ